MYNIDDWGSGGGEGGGIAVVSNILGLGAGLASDYVQTREQPITKLRCALWRTPPRATPIVNSFTDCTTQKIR